MAGDLHADILAAVARLGAVAYGVPIRRHLLDAGRSVSYGALYVALDALEAAEMLTSEEGDPTPERGGRPKRFYRITNKGRAVLAEAAVAELSGSVLPAAG